MILFESRWIIVLKSNTNVFLFVGTGLGAGASTLGGSNLGGFGNVDQGTLAALKQQQMIQQQLKAIANTPFGDSPLFRNLPVNFFS